MYYLLNQSCFTIIINLILASSIKKEVIIDEQIGINKSKKTGEKMIKKLVLAVMFVGGACNTAFAVPIASDSDYFTAQHIVFQDQREWASYESDFGLYSMADPTDKYEIFSYLDEPGFMTLDSVSAGEWNPLAQGFGFYFDVHTGGLGDSTVDYNWFSDQTLNQLADGTSADTDIEHISVSTFPFMRMVQISLDDQLGGGDRDFTDMIVGGFSCQIEPVAMTGIAPVPEPATILLFGTGLVGLMGVSRKKKKEHNS